MLTCITCSKQRMEDDDEDAPRGSPSTRDAVKSLTSQIKDMALKVSGSQKGKENGRMKEVHGVPQPSYLHHQGAGSSSCSSTPAWDYYNNRTTTGFSRFSAFSSNDNIQQNDDSEPKEWMAQVEPGVQITFVSLPRGGNDLKRIRFSREMFNKWQAQSWWGENYDRIMELYNVQRFNQQALNTPGRSEDGRDSSYSRLESPRITTPTPARYSRFQQEHHNQRPLPPPYPRTSEMEASRTTTSSRDEASVSISNASEVETEWIEEDEPGVYITIRQLVDGTRELRRVRFSRERFGEVHAKLWWDTNRDRIQSQYLCQS